MTDRQGVRQPLRAFIVEDEWPARNYLAELLHESGLAQVVGAVPNIEAAREILLASDISIDVAFVDIKLAGDPADDAGLRLVRELAGRPQAPSCVIASAFPQHTLEAFELGVVDYLLKPFSDERVGQCLRRLHARRGPTASPPEPTRIVARRRKSLVFLALNEVWAVEAVNRLAFVHSSLGRFDLDLSLTAIEAICGSSLLRVHRNWLVNLAHVRELERDGSDTTLYLGPGIGPSGAGIRAPVARDRVAQVREALLATAVGLRRSPDDGR